MLALLLAALLPATADARSCLREGRTIASSEAVRVYVVDNGDFEEPTYACPLGGGPRLRLVRSDLAVSGADGVQVAGDRVFFLQGSYSRSTGDVSLDVRVVDVGRRRIQHRWSFYEPHLGGVAPSLSVRGARLAPDGSVAFLVGGVDADHRFEVHRADATGRSRVDAGGDIDPASLAVGPRRIYWQRAGQVRSAAFAPRGAPAVRLARRAAEGRCARRRSTTVAANERVRIYRVRRAYDRSLTTVVACRRGTGRRWVIGGSDLFGGGGDPVALAGDQLLTSSGPADGRNPDFSLSLEVLDLRRRVGRCRWVFEGEPPVVVHGATVHADGAAAFLVGPVARRRADGGFDGDRYEVHKADASGQAVLDSAADVHPGSFAAGEAWIYWGRSGAIRAARWR